MPAPHPAEDRTDPGPRRRTAPADLAVWCATVAAGLSINTAHPLFTPCLTVITAAALLSRVRTPLGLLATVDPRGRRRRRGRRGL